MPNEFDLKDEVHDRLKVCRRRGLPLWFRKIHGHAMQAVTLDFLFCYDGRFKAIELKRAGEIPTPMQSREIRDIRAARGVAEVAYSWQEVCEILRLPAWCLTVPRR